MAGDSICFVETVGDDPWKTFRATRCIRRTVESLIILFFGLLASSLALAYVHDKQPVIPPLYDIVFENVSQMDRGLQTAEYLIMLVVYPTVAVIALHQHRWIIARRFFILTGLVYLLRGLTIVCTVLPQADLKYPCSPRLENPETHVILERAVTLLSGAGMSINGKLIYCGDYIYSGHTSSLVLSCMFFAEYTPQEWATFRWLNRLLLGVAFFAISCVSLSRTHYLIDILIAYAVTSTLFRVYHTVASNRQLREKNALWTESWYLGLIEHFERDLPNGKLPNGFDIPWRNACARVRQQRTGPENV